MQLAFDKYHIVITYTEDSAKYYFSNSSGTIKIESLIYENLRQTEVLEQYVSQISLTADILHCHKYNITKRTAMRLTEVVLNVFS
jgi:hypothetical protein